MTNTLVLNLFLLTAICSRAEILINKQLVSPDHSKTFTVMAANGEYKYIIKEIKTGKVFILDADYQPVLDAKWDSDSKSICVAAHVAMGILVQILHFNGREWAELTIDAPEHKYNASVALDWVITPNIVTLWYKVGLRKDNGVFYSFYKERCDVDVATGKICNTVKTRLSDKEQHELRSKFEKDQVTGYGYTW